MVCFARGLRSFTLVATMLALLLPAAACKAKDEPGADGGEKARVTISTAAGASHEFTAELAMTPEKLTQGLMFRSSMPEDHGMLFLFGHAREQNFWMKNTYIPLDILFIRDDGTINHIHENAVPHDETPLPSHGPVSSVLEINGGRAATLGIKAGDRVTYEPLP